jgi:hypothetical protein
MALTADVQWREQYASHALNRKLAGVVQAGVYWGFEVTPAGGLQLEVGLGDDPDYPVSVAVVERDGYSLTCRMDTQELIDIPEAGRTYEIVLEASYVLGQQTDARLKAVPSAAEHHVVLARVDVPSGATAITADMITFDARDVANPALNAAKILTQFTQLTTSLIDVKDRLTNLEAWAETQGYTP